MGELSPSCHAFVLEVDSEIPLCCGGSLSCQRAVDDSPAWVTGSRNSEVSMEFLAFPW